jgi:hypothetical protein
VSSKNCNAAPRWRMSGAVTADPPC